MYRKNYRIKWRRRRSTGPHYWESFVGRSRTGKKWYKINFGFTTPYNSVFYNDTFKNSRTFNDYYRKYKSYL